MHVEHNPDLPVLLVMGVNDSKTGQIII